ncbi:response regulator [Paenibacillus sp. 1P07SE]|uniref:response regulator n=1 Tax=Paenibacillus sp. 1P07SE TaxID=3132209 RepID=UPI0039A4091D
MNAILIDDEKPALQQLERLLKKDGRIHIAGKYTSARKGLEHLKQQKTDLVFLDIGMPEMNGLEAAEHIQAIHPGIRIVYITAYANYAVEAFELHALDYLLKPINPERFQKTLERISQAMHPEKPDQPLAPLAAAWISCFKRLELYHAEGEKRRLKWRTYKAQEMFAYLLHHNERWVLKDQIVDAVWQEYEQDKAVTYLHTTVYHIRKLLKDWGVQAKVEFSQERYRLLKTNLETDVEKFERLVEAGEIRDDDQARRSEQAISLYRGEYLEEHDYAWASPKRKQLHQQFIAINLRLAEYDLRRGEDRLALERLLQLQEKEPYSEEICRRVMEAFIKARSHGQARAHYHHFAQLLQDELGIEPEREFKQWAQTLLSG